jgi:serine/threonine protein phosphatase PrpC
MADELDRLQAPEVSSQPEQTSSAAMADELDRLQAPEVSSQPEQTSPAPITDELDKSQIPEDSSQQELTSFENPAEMLNRFQASENTVRPVMTDPAVSSAAESVTDNNADVQNADLKTIAPSGMLSENEAEKPSENAFAPSGSDKNTDMQTSDVKTIAPPRDSSANETAAPSESFAASAGEPDSVQLNTGTEAKPESAQESPRPINWPRVDDDPKSPVANAKTPHEAEVKQDPVQDVPKPRPNPRALWKDIPSKPDFYSKPDTASAFCLADNGKVKIFGASRRGRSHAHVGSPRDDDFQIKTDDITGWTYLVVADGAGSAKYSREGAKQACKVVAGRLPDLVKNEKFQEALTRLESNPGFGEAELEQLRKSAYYVLPKAAHEASKSLSDLVPSAPEKAELRDFATTLLCVITRKIHDRQLIISFAIGDGAIAVYDAGNSANTHLMNTPDSGEFAGQTRFLTMKSIFANSQEIMARIRIQCVPDYTAIMLMTDGVSDAKFETESLLEDKAKWDDFWQDLTENGSDDSPPLKLDSSAEDLSEQLLEWLNFWVVGNHDDRTIVVMCKGGAAK